ncbi:hypothetical protein Tco_0826579 [Tanacetum coccineum]
MNFLSRLYLNRSKSRPDDNTSDSNLACYELSISPVFDIQNHGPMTTPQIPITATGRVAAKYLRQNHAENISTKTVQIPMTVTGKKLGQNHGENIPTTTQMKIGVTREGLDLKLSKGAMMTKVHREREISTLFHSSVASDSDLISSGTSKINSDSSSVPTTEDGGDYSEVIPVNKRTLTQDLKILLYTDLKHATCDFITPSSSGQNCSFIGWVHEKTYTPSKPGVGLPVVVKEYIQTTTEAHKISLSLLGFTS